MLGRARRSAGAGWRAGSIPRPRGRWGFAPRARPALIGLVALVAVAALSAVGALLAPRCSSSRPRPRAVAPRLPPGRSRPWCWSPLEGAGGLWLSVEPNAPPGATIAVLAGGVFASPRSPALARLPRAPPRPCGGDWRAALRAAGAGCGARGSSGRSTWSRRPRRSPTSRARSAASGRRPPDPAAEHRPARLRAAARATSQAAAGARSCSRAATASTTGSDDVVDQAAATREVVDLGDGRARPLPARSGGGTGRPALVARPAQRRSRRRSRSATRWSRADPGARRRVPRATPRPTCAELARLDTRHRALHRARPGRRAQARHRPRRLRLLREPLRDRGRRRGDPVADDARRSLRPATSATLVALDRARARAGRSSPRVAQRRSWPTRSRARRAPAPTRRSTATRSVPRARRATPT